VADLWSERTSLQSLSPQELLDLILAARIRRREQRITSAAKHRAKAAPSAKAKPDPLSMMSMEQLLKLVEVAGGKSDS
jgi:hypothetical protein